MNPGTLTPVQQTAHDDIAALAARSEELSAQELAAAMVERFGDRVSLACSFQKEESVLLDMLFSSRAESARLRDRHPLPLPGDVRALA